MNTPQEAAAAILQCSAATIGCHVNPDGDAIGSALALAFALGHMGKRATLLCSDPVPDNLLFLPGAGLFSTDPPPSPPELAIVVDLEAMARLGRLAEHFARAEKTLTIDHHEPNELFGDVRLIDSFAAATAEIVYRVIVTLNVPIDDKIATALLTGLVTDTGGFRFPNTRPDSLVLAASLMRQGADLTNIFEHAYENRSFAAQVLLGRALANLQRTSEAPVVWSALAHRDFVETGCTDADTDGIVNHLRAIRDAEVAVLFRESAPGRVRVSLRSKGQVDVSEIARRLGGGGHRNAAGCSFQSSLQDAIDTTLREVLSCTGSSS